jgi:hypothetical protein
MLRLRPRKSRIPLPESALATGFAPTRLSNAYVKMCANDSKDITLCSEINSQPWNLPYMPAIGDLVIFPTDHESYASCVGRAEKITHQTFEHDGDFRSYIYCRQLTDD